MSEYSEWQFLCATGMLSRDRADEAKSDTSVGSEYNRIEVCLHIPGWPGASLSQHHLRPIAW